MVDADHAAGKVENAFRPNQILAVGGLPIALVEGAVAKQIVEAVEQRLWTPLGLRSLAPGEPGYIPCYQGGVRERDGAYHQGIVWPWLIGPFVEGWVRVNGNNAAAKRTARARFLEPFLRHIDEAGLGHVSEIADAEEPTCRAAARFRPGHSPSCCVWIASYWRDSELVEYWSGAVKVVLQQSKCSIIQSDGFRTTLVRCCV